MCCPPFENRRVGQELHGARILQSRQPRQAVSNLRWLGEKNGLGGNVGRCQFWHAYGCTLSSAELLRPARSPLTSRHRCAGESGSSRTSTPREASAAATALAAVAATATMPPSPAPLAPSGLVFERRSSMVMARTLGKSQASGTR